MSDTALLAVGVALAMVLGLAAHNAGICMVKAVAEVMTSRRPLMLLALAKTSAWSFVAIVAGSWVGGGTAFTHWPLAWPEVVGGVVFGLGAAINGSCVFSTLARLADGKSGMLAAVAMWPVGALVAKAWLVDQDVTGLPRQVNSLDTVQRTPWIVVIGIAVWAMVEFWRIGVKLWKGRGTAGLRTGPLTLSSGAFLIGLSNGYLYHHFQDWSFTSAAMQTISGSDMAPAGRAYVAWLLLVSAFFGMFISSRMRGSQDWRLPGQRDVIRHAVGGLAMGFGTGLIPGGNDALILYGIPSLSPHAVPATVGILTGAAIGLAAKRAANCRMSNIDHQSDAGTG